MDDTTVEHWEPASKGSGLSPDSVSLLVALIDSVQISMANPNAVAQAQAFARARSELTAHQGSANA